MKTLRKLTASLFLLCMAATATAQDVIVMKDQTTVMSKVLEINSTEIKYKKWNNLDGPIYSILRSEVVSINYENGEVERFNEATSNQSIQNNQQNTYSPQVNRGYMEESASFPAAMKLNGRRLTHEEVQNLVDEQTYQLYLKGKRQVNYGEVIGVVGLVPLCLGVGFLFRTPEVEPGNRSDYLKFSLASIAIGTAAVIPGIVLSVAGGNNLRQVAETYNQNQGSHYSLNIYPSMMKCDIIQSQGNYGLGLTFSVDF